MNEFQKALDKFGVQADSLGPPEAFDKIQQYCILLWHKNEVMNLTRHTDWETFVSRDLVDTLALAALIPADQEVLDVGSGGGVPGLLMAIIRPDLEISLTESVGKKAAALAEFATVLDIPVQIYRERAENILADLRYDVTIARAVGSLTKLMQWFDDKWLNVNRLLAIKGPNWQAELKEAEAAGGPEKLRIQTVATYNTPGTEWDSFILEIRSKSDNR